MFLTGALLESNGLHLILEMFATLIQSGKAVFIDQNTRLKVYTFSRPNIVGTCTRFFTSNMSEFLRKSRSIVDIKKDWNNMCFSFPFVLGLAYLKEDKVSMNDFEVMVVMLVMQLCGLS